MIKNSIQKSLQSEELLIKNKQDTILKVTLVFQKIQLNTKI